MQTALGAARSEASPGHLWQVPGKHLAVRLSHAVVRTILKAPRRLFGRSFETGGILVGRFEQDAAGGTLVSVEESVAVPCEHLFGRRYSLCENDKEDLRAALDEIGQAGSPWTAVGFYRTHRRGGLGLDDDDLALYDEVFPGPEPVVLLVKRRRLRPSLAAFFFRENGMVRAEASYLELPVRAGRPPKPPATHGRGMRWYSLWAQVPLFLCLLFADARLGYITARGWHQSRPAAVQPRDPYALSLLVLEYAENLHVSWDRNATSIQAGGRGLLHITDGEETRSVELGPAQLKSGSLVYRRLTPRVEFRLEVFVNDQRSVTESWKSAAAGGRR